jgi:hypothetical protein
LGSSQKSCQESIAVFDRIFSFFDFKKNVQETCDDGGHCTYDPDSCGTTEADYLLSINDEAYAELEAGLATCTRSCSNGLEEYGAGGQYEGYYRTRLIELAHECRVESGLRYTPCENLIYDFFMKIEGACPRTNCDDKRCPYTPESCNTTACADSLSSLDYDAYAKLEAPLNCTNESEDFYRSALISRANDCGVESGLSKTPCEEFRLFVNECTLYRENCNTTALMELAVKCTVESGSSTSLCEKRAVLLFYISKKKEIACPPANVDDKKGFTYTLESCSTTACADYLSSFIDEDTYAKLEAPLNCTNEYAWLSGPLVGRVRSDFISRANDCGVESGLSKTPCDEFRLFDNECRLYQENCNRTALMELAVKCRVESGHSNTLCEERALLLFYISQKKEIACPPTNFDDEIVMGLTYTLESCSTTACADYLSSFIDDDTYAKLEAPLNCTNEYAALSGPFVGRIRSAFMSRAIDCGVESGLSKTPCQESTTMLLEADIELVIKCYFNECRPYPENCNTTACVNFFSLMDDGVAKDKFFAALATCPNEHHLFLGLQSVRIWVIVFGVGPRFVVGGVANGQDKTR